MNYLAMSYDHRIIDGARPSTGLVAMKDALEDPRCCCSTCDLQRGVTRQPTLGLARR